MKTRIIMGVLILVGGIILAGILNDKSAVVQYTAPVATSTDSTTIPVVEHRDVVEEARAELERINNELDAEEVRLLEEIQERESRLEDIRATRMSFQ